MSELQAQAGRQPPVAALDDVEEAITAMPLEIAPALAPFAVETVAAIKARGLATALVCNAGFTTAPHLLPMLAHYGLSPCLDVMVFSDELGFAKPDARIFAKALEGIGVAAAECAFVGDNPHTDIGGAQAVGLFAVQVGGKRRDGIVPNVRIDDLSELLDVLRAFPG
jgi:HAD superfamily hydrolase (TIGR01509 family)